MGPLLGKFYGNRMNLARTLHERIVTLPQFDQAALEMMRSIPTDVDHFESKKLYWLLDDIAVKHVTLRHLVRDKFSAQHTGSKENKRRKHRRTRGEYAGKQGRTFTPSF